MNPFIINGKKDDKYLLPLCVQGCGDGRKPFDLIKGKSMCELLLPQGHSLEASWSCILDFENQIFLTFSAASTGVGGWREVGSLNIFVSTSIDWDGAPWSTATRFPMGDFKVSSIFKMVIEESNFYSECGLEFISKEGSVFRIAAGVAPSSMSIEFPESKDLFAPEFSIDEYKLVEL